MAHSSTPLRVSLFGLMLTLLLAPVLLHAQAPVPDLQAQLDARRAEWATDADPEAVRVYQEGVQAVAESGVLERALPVGELAPTFTLPDATGKPVALADLLAKGPVVLTWYRGGWCPYCNLQLRAYQKLLPQLAELGATLVAISPEVPDSSLSTQAKNELAFPVLSDANNAVAEQFGLVYPLPDGVRARFEGRLDLPAYNGDSSWTLPLAATYVINRHGEVVYRFVDAEYRRRAQPADILAAVELATR